jgi:hypothetical protein
MGRAGQGRFHEQVTNWPTILLEYEPPGSPHDPCHLQYVLLVQEGGEGGAEFVADSSVKDNLDRLVQVLRVHFYAADLSVPFERGLYVHGHEVHEFSLQEIPNNLWTSSVGIQFDR